MTSGAASLAEADLPTLSTAGKVSGGAINSGIIAGTASPSKLLEVNGDTLINGTLSMASTSPYGPATWINSTTSQIRGSRDYIDLQKYVRVDKNLAVGGAGWAGLDTLIPTLYVNGKTGLGTAAPLSLLDVSGGVAIGTYAGTSAAHIGVRVTSVGTGTVNTGILVSAVTAATTNYGIEIASPTSGTNNYAIYSNATAKSYFAGNVGIGTTGPSEKLHVV